MTLGPLMIDLLGTQLLPEERELLKHPLLGGVILFGHNFESREQVKQLVADIRAVRSPPLLVAVDYEGGRVQRFRKEFTLIPPMRMLGRAYDENAAHGVHLAQQIGWLLAAELRAIDIDLNFGPVVDLEYGASSVIGDRALHRNARVVAELAIALMHGMREAGMHAVAKHFPGHGAVVADSHVALPVDHRRYADLSNDLYPYARLIDNGLSGVMAAHVVFDQIDSLPASFSRHWLVEELRSRLGFKGAVFSDDLTMEGASVIGDMPQRVVRGLAAGCDMVLICHRRETVVQMLGKLSLQPDPSSQVRLAGMRGRTVLGESALFASARWQTANATMRSMLELRA